MSPKIQSMFFAKKGDYNTRKKQTDWLKHNRLELMKGTKPNVTTHFIHYKLLNYDNTKFYKLVNIDNHNIALLQFDKKKGSGQTDDDDDDDDFFEREKVRQANEAIRFQKNDKNDKFDEYQSQRFHDMDENLLMQKRMRKRLARPLARQSVVGIIHNPSRVGELHVNPNRLTKLPKKPKPEPEPKPKAKQETEAEFLQDIANIGYARNVLSQSQYSIYQKARMSGLNHEESMNHVRSL
jgi:hypothetical protein